jgi:hypothetical protein
LFVRTKGNVPGKTLGLQQYKDLETSQIAGGWVEVKDVLCIAYNKTKI